ncbi:hypothetical protein HX744_32225 [Pseudonocardia sp. ICBG1122]|nr:hypothetical protein [Pseudonocardia pini]
MTTQDELGVAASRPSCVTSLVGWMRTVPVVSAAWAGRPARAMAQHGAGRAAVPVP